MSDNNDNTTNANAAVEEQIFGVPYEEAFDIAFDGKRYDPQDDITPVEIARLLQVFTCILITQVPLDTQRFIRDHGLERHFTPIIKTPDSKIIV